MPWLKAEKNALWAIEQRRRRYGVSFDHSVLWREEHKRAGLVKDGSSDFQREIRKLFLRYIMSTLDGQMLMRNKYFGASLRRQWRVRVSAALAQQPLAA